MKRTLFLSLLLLASPAAAQDPGSAAETTVLPPEHWAYDVAHRVDGARLTNRGEDPGAGTVTVAAMARLLSAAAARAEALDHPLQLQLLDWLDRLRTEYPHAFTEAGAAVAGRLRLQAGMSAHQNPLVPRTGDANPPSFEPDTLTGFVGARATLSLAGRFTLEADAVATSAGVELREGYAAARAGRIGIWAGRRRPGFLTTAGGGMVLGRAAAWDGGGLWLTRPLRLPLLGPVHFESFLAAADSSGAVSEPWFWATRFTVEPLPRFTIGVTRGIVFGDSAGGRAIDWGEFGEILIGQSDRGAGDPVYPDNQVVAVDGRFRLPTAPLPLELYLTWGAEDSAGAWWDSPAIIGGVFAPVLPGAPAFSLGVERAVVTSTGNHGHLYNHSFLRRGWQQQGELMGHPLGGTGREWLLYGSYDRGTRGPAAHWRGFRRVRPPGNRLAPTHAGTSWGGALQLSRFAGPFQLHGLGGIELGDGWKTGSAELRLEWQPIR